MCFPQRADTLTASPPQTPRTEEDDESGDDCIDSYPGDGGNCDDDESEGLESLLDDEEQDND